ncbi:hypothetical protein CTEN210_11836 [Chaetoceros tenuissimus]|uniref:G-protein coupled receptors family 1 profile domain-containing protein n=1 Tax=Chaetoceros tenuissimus TaxID=426638 RepID=A0AAD3D2J5_9STRA|nr:hypothetical protein CTEN210_11836 [Chaetoceros tenuissimus]
MSITTNSKHYGLIVGGQILRCSTAILSFFGSTTITIMILKSKKGLKSPYSRIIFGLSIADMMQSFGIFISPWTSPRNESEFALWSIGTKSTCEATGFFLSVGAGVVPFYIFFLTFYFLRKVKCKVQPKEFRLQEQMLHIFIWLYNIVCSIIPTIKGKISPTRYGSLCVINTEEDLRKSLISLFFYATSGVCFIGILVTLSMLTCYVYNEEKKLVHIRSERPTREINNNDSASEIEQDVLGAENTSNERNTSSNTQEDSNPSSNSSIAMSSLKQSSLYVFTFLLTYLPLLAQLFTNGNKESADKIWVFWLISATWPLAGFLNILIYTRPKVLKFKELHPQMSWLSRFSKVVLSGGEIPAEAMSSRHIRRPESKNNARVYKEVVHPNKAGNQNGSPNDQSNISYPINICMDHQGSSSEVVSSVQCYDLGSHEDVSEDNILYNRESNWSYVEGGSELEIFGAMQEEEEDDDEISEQESAS